MSTQAGELLRSSSLGPFRVRELEYPAGVHIAPHYHDCSNVSLLLAGTLEETVGGTTHRPSPGQVVVKPAGTIHSNQFGRDGARLLQIEIPSSQRLPASLHGTLPSWKWIWDSRIIRSILEIYATAGAQENVGTNGGAQRIEELLSMLPPSWTAPSIIPDWLRQLRTELHQDFHQPISVAALCQRFKRHPVYVARIFRRCFGSSIKEYVRSLRIQSAAAQLALSRLNAAAIAFDSGFSDQSHMCRCFKSEMGLTPLDFRRMTARASSLQEQERV